MKTNLDKVDELAETLKALQPLNSDYQKKLDKKFRLEFNYNSNHLEGNTLTYGETKLLLLFDDTIGNHTMREYEEMKAHDVAYRLVEDWAKDIERPLTEQNIKNLNQIILVRPFWKDAITPDGQNTRRQIIVGNYKEQPNSVRLANGEIFPYASPAETPILMQELIDWYRTEERTLHPVTLAAMLHYKFVRIHPFDDGNGRVSRLLMNYVLLRNGLPPVIIKSEDKRNYLGALHLADIGNYEPFIDYIAQQAVWSLEISIKAAKGEDIEEEEDWKKVLKLRTKEEGEVPPFSIEKAQMVQIQNVYKLVKHIDEELAEYEILFDTVERVLLGQRSEIEKIKSIPLQYDYKKGIEYFSSYKKTLLYKPHSFNYIIKCTFKEYSYILKLIIDSANYQQIEKKYNQLLSEEEINRLVNYTGKHLVKFIENLEGRKAK